jgi:bisphosphoglycerate-independent phosphoglycerate mutase (AlkP superfamily)
MRKVLLVVLDGWGHSDFEGPPSPGNAVELARVPTFRKLFDEPVAWAWKASPRAYGNGAASSIS